MKKLNLTLFLAVFCTVFSFSQVPNYVPTNGLVGWWPFNGNANDESGNGNNGTVNGATLTTDRNGVANRAYGFDGAGNFIEVADDNTLDLSNNYTLSAWFKLYDYSSLPADPFRVILGKGRQLGWASGYGLFAVNGNISNTFGSIQWGGVNNGGLTPAPLNLWQNIIYSYDGINCNLYYNGVLINSQTATYSLGNYITSLYFGKEFDSSTNWNRFFKGELDDIGIWNRALTQQEITTLYQGCNLNLTANPTQANTSIGANATFNSSGATTYQWQTNALNLGWQNIPNNASYSGATSSSLTVNNVQLQNHQQALRVIGTDGNCSDTAFASIILADTCVNTVFDTLTTSVTVTDTLLINAVLTGVNPPNNTNTLQVYPNPAKTHITIDNGNFALMNGYSVRINNALGQTVFSQQVTQQQFYIDLSTWTGSGLYYLDLIDNLGNSIASKVIVIQ